MSTKRQKPEEIVCKLCLKTPAGRSMTSGLNGCGDVRG